MNPDLRIFRRLAGALLLGMNSALITLSASPLQAATELLAEESGPVPAPSCATAQCGKVLSIDQRAGWATPYPFGTSGVYLSDSDGQPYDPYVIDDNAADYPFYGYDPQPITLWVITVGMQNGMTLSFQQTFEPLFQIGEIVAVEGDKLRLARESYK